MLLACIIESKSTIKTAELIKSIFKSKQQRINIFDKKIDNLKEYVKKLNKSNHEIYIIKTGIEQLQTLQSQNLRFDILVFEDVDDEAKYNSFTFFKSILTLLKPHAYLIINSDNFDFFNHFDLKNYYVVTYGFNRHANLSTSSIGDMFNNSNFMCFLKKTIHSYNGVTFEPQEYIINLGYWDNKPYNILAAAVFAIINGIDLNSINSVGEVPYP